jgi:hypothetical protein
VGVFCYMLAIFDGHPAGQTKVRRRRGRAFPRGRFCEGSGACVPLAARKGAPVVSRDNLRVRPRFRHLGFAHGAARVVAGRELPVDRWDTALARHTRHESGYQTMSAKGWRADAGEAGDLSRRICGLSGPLALGPRLVPLEPLSNSVLDCAWRRDLVLRSPVIRSDRVKWTKRHA